MYLMLVTGLVVLKMPAEMPWKSLFKAGSIVFYAVGAITYCIITPLLDGRNVCILVQGIHKKPTLTPGREVSIPRAAEWKDLSCAQIGRCL